MALQLKMDPTGVEAGAAKAKEALQGVTREAFKADQALVEMGGATKEWTAAPIVKVGDQVEAAGAKSFLAGNNMRMLSMQLSQVGQQAMATGNVAQALAIQLPDIGLAFGAAGAAAGLLAGVALPVLMSALGNTGNVIKRLQDDSDKLGNSIDTLRRIASQTAATGLEDLRKKYGEVDAELLTLIGHQREEANISAMNAAKDAIKAIADQYRVTSGDLNIFRITGAGAAKEVADSLGMTKNQFIAFQNALRASQTAKTFEDQATALAQVDGYLKRSTANGSEMANAVTDAALSMREVDAAAKDAEGGIKDATTAAQVLASTQPGDGWLGTAISRAQTLASTLWNAAAAAAAAQGAEMTARGAAGYGGRPEGIQNDTASRQAVIVAQQHIAALGRANTPSGGGGASVSKELTEAEKAQQAMNEAIAKGSDAYGIFQDAAGNAIDKLISGTGSLKDALRGMIKEMEIALIKGALLGHVTGATADMSIGQLLVKGIFSGFHDAGGTIPNGMTGVVGERGPELVTAGAGGAVVTSRVDTARMMQQQVHVSVSVDDDGKIKAYVAQSGRQVHSQVVHTVKRSLSGWNSQLSTDGALA